MIEPHRQHAMHEKRGGHTRDDLRAKIREKVAVAELAAELAHQLNNPLEALRNLIYMARTEALDDALHGMLAEAEFQLERMSSVVHSIATVQKADPDERLRNASRLLDAETFRRINEEYKSALHLASIVESAQDAIYSKKLDGTIMAWNAEAERLFGYSAQEALGRSVRILVPSDLAEEERQILNRIKSGERVAHYETVRRTKAGGTVRVSVTISPIRNTSGRVVGASTIAREITPE